MTINQDELKDIIGQAIGQASLFWIPSPAGVFHSEKAERLVEDTVAKISTLKDNRWRDMPDMFWDADDPEAGADDARSICDNAPLQTVVTLQTAKRLKNKYGVWLSGVGEDFKVFDTEAEAEAAIEQFNATLPPPPESEGV